MLSGDVSVSPGVFQALKDEYESARVLSPAAGRNKGLSPAPDAHLNPELLFGAGGGAQLGRSSPRPGAPSPGTSTLEGLEASQVSGSRRAMSTPSSQEAVERLEEQDAHLANVQADLRQLLHTTSAVRDALHGSPHGRETASPAASDSGSASASAGSRPSPWEAASLGFREEVQRASASLDALEEKVALLLREKALNSGLAEAVARHEGLAQKFEALASQVWDLRGEVGPPSQGGEDDPDAGSEGASLREQLAMLRSGLASAEQDLEAWKADQALREDDAQISRAEIDLRLAAAAGDVETLRESMAQVSDCLESCDLATIESRIKAICETAESARARMEEMDSEIRGLRGAQAQREEVPPAEGPPAVVATEEAAAGVSEALQNFQALWQQMESKRQELEVGASVTPEAIRTHVDAAVGDALDRALGDLRDRYDTLALSVLEMRTTPAGGAETVEGGVSEGGASEVLEAKLAMMEAEVAGVAEDLEQRLTQSDATHREAAASLAREVEALKLACAPSGFVPGPDGVPESLGSAAAGEGPGAGPPGEDFGSMLTKLHSLEKCVSAIDQEVKSLSWIAEGEGSAPPAAPSTPSRSEPPASPSLDRMEELLPGILRRELVSFAETLVHLESAVARLELELKEAKRSADSRGDALDSKLRGLEAAAADAKVARVAVAPQAVSASSAEALAHLEGTVSRLDSELKEARRDAESRGKALEGRFRDLATEAASRVAAAVPPVPAPTDPPASAPASPGVPASPPRPGGADASGLEEVVAGLVQRPLGGLLRKSRELEARLSELGKENAALREQATLAEKAMRGVEERLAQHPSPEGSPAASEPAAAAPPSEVTVSASPPSPTVLKRPPLSAFSVVLIFAALNCSMLWLSALFSRHGLGGALGLPWESGAALPT